MDGDFNLILSRRNIFFVGLSSIFEYNLSMNGNCICKNCGWFNLAGQTYAWQEHKQDRKYLSFNFRIVVYFKLS